MERSSIILVRWQRLRLSLKCFGPDDTCTEILKALKERNSNCPLLAVSSCLGFSDLGHQKRRLLRRSAFDPTPASLNHFSDRSTLVENLEVVAYSPHITPCGNDAPIRNPMGAKRIPVATVNGIAKGTEMQAATTPSLHSSIACL